MPQIPPQYRNLPEIELNRLIINKVGIVIAKYNKDVHCYSCKTKLKFIRQGFTRTGKTVWYCPKCQKYMSSNDIPIIPPRLIAAKP